MPKFSVRFVRDAHAQYTGVVEVTARSVAAACRKAETLLMQGRVEFVPVPNTVEVDAAVILRVDDL